LLKNLPERTAMPSSPPTSAAPAELRACALACLLEADPATKVAMVAAMAAAGLALDAKAPWRRPVPFRAGPPARNWCRPASWGGVR
jgi:hypothetical protein